MRYDDETGGKSVDGFFAGDLPGGGHLIECEACDYITQSREKMHEPLYCKQCGVELHYKKIMELVT